MRRLPSYEERQNVNAAANATLQGLGSEAMNRLREAAAQRLSESGAANDGKA
ncbi:MAG: hypothetical protein ABFD54_12855 [Armatimonadota bacterium]|nr:hypothetical protein [bacterium]